MGNLGAEIQIGNLDRRVTFRQVTEVQSSSGAITETYSDVATVWAAINMKKGTERMMANRETAVDKTHFTIRYRTDIDEKMQLWHEAKKYDIVSISEIPETRKRFLEVVVEKRI